MSNAARERRRSFSMLRYDCGIAKEVFTVDARDLPTAWRRAERDAQGRSFALYGDDRVLLRVGVTPPAPFSLPQRATAVALAPDAERLFTGHEDGSVRAYDPVSGSLHWERVAGAARIDCIVLPARAPWIVACTRAGEITVMDRTRGDTLLHLADDEARAIAIAPDDRTLALAGAVVELWSLPEGVRSSLLDGDVAAERQARAIGEGTDAVDDSDGDPPEDEGVYAVAFAQDGKRVVGLRGRRGGELVVWDPVSATRVGVRAGCPISRIAVLRDGSTALLALRDHGARIHRVDLASLEAEHTYETGAEGLWDLRVTPDDRFALAHDDETGVYVVDLRSGSTHAWLDDFEACAYAVRRGRGDRNRRGESARAADDTRVVQLPRWRRDDPGAPLSLDGRRYAALRRYHGEGLVALFDLHRCAPYAALAHAHAVVSVWLNRDGTCAVTRDTQGQVFVWSIPDAPERLD